MKSLVDYLKKYRFEIVLIGVLTLGAALRFYGINWDENSYLHPDERMILMVVNDLELPSSWAQFLSSESPLNPNFFAYGGFPMYLLKGLQMIGDKFSTGEVSFWELKVIGRTLSVIFDTFTMLIVYFLGKRYWSAVEGILAALLYATTVFLIQGSHFYAVDIQLTFWCTLAVFLILRVYKQPSWKKVLGLAVVVGFAGATKITAVFLFAPLIVCFTLILIRGFVSGVSGGDGDRLTAILPKLILLLVISVSVFFLLQPYALLDFRQFKEEIILQARMSKDALLFPYTIQFVGTLPYGYFIKNILLWGLGLPLGLLAVIGFGRGLLTAIRRFSFDLLGFTRGAEAVISASWAAVYFWVVGSSVTKFMRYMMPLYPFLVLMAAFGFITLIRWSRGIMMSDRGSGCGFKRCGRVVLSFTICVLPFFYTFAFMQIYREPHTRISATKWIHENIASGSVIALEHWDDSLPLYGGEKFNLIKLELYATDNPLKAQETENIVNSSDYIIISSKRLYKSIPRLPQKYVWATQYYHDLFSGGLGFEKVAEFTSYPRIGFAKMRLEMNDDGADESFTVYDHPKVMIFARGE